MEKATCHTCTKRFVRKWHSSRIICHSCQQKLAARVIRREREQMSPAMAEAKLSELIANETRMPWERVKP